MHVDVDARDGWGYAKKIEDPSSAFEATAFLQSRQRGKTAREACIKMEKENYC